MESGRRNMNFRASTGAYTWLGPVKTEEKLPPHKELSDVIFSSHPQFLYCEDFWCHENLNPNKILVKERNHAKARSYYYLINTVWYTGWEGVVNLKIFRGTQWILYILLGVSSYLLW